jgi:hypothetical protein
MSCWCPDDRNRSADSTALQWYWKPLAVAVAVAWFLVAAPLGLSYEAAIDVDTSYRLVLGAQHTLGLKSGTDLSYTFGPLGFICFQSLAPMEALLRPTIWLVFYGAFSVALTVVLVVCTRSIRNTLLLASVVTLGASSTAMADPLMVLSLPSLLLLALTLRSSITVPSFARRCLALAISVAMLTKFSYFILASIALLAHAVVEIHARRPPKIVADVTIAVCALWVALGQDLSAIPNFVIGSMQVATGYGEVGVSAGQAEWVLVSATGTTLVALGVALWLLMRKWPFGMALSLWMLWMGYVAVGVKIGFTVYTPTHFALHAMGYLFSAALVVAVAAWQRDRIAAIAACASGFAALTMAGMVMPSESLPRKLSGLQSRIERSIAGLSGLSDQSQRA